MSKNLSAWKIAIREREGNDDYFWDHNMPSFQIIEMPGRYWAADPFLFTHDGVDYLFYEAFDWYRRRGVLAYSVLRDGKATKPRVILKCPYHLSYPYIFTYRKDIYLMPETSGNKTIELYRAVQFPDDWEKISTLIEHVNAVDSILIEEKCQRYLLTSEMSNENFLEVENYIFPLEGMVLQSAERQCVGKGTKGYRNGGAVFSYRGQRIRVGQDCSGHQYGKGLIFWNVCSVSPYQEVMVREVFPDDIEFIGKCGNPRGLHTYNNNERYEVIDLLTTMEIPYYIVIIGFIHRCYKYVVRKIKRWWR